ncbi:hypothetical protein CC78DRAFT_581556 [Lojkania enalia]|uniref:WDR59/RTC1-like RING zinc finger domain-containing protein n=1 Tax=Lojkania enalia TaxID=147567 RepID=A0A9P4K9B6_9PLEO|nr:hypothetical protein CC78DRAFT_581556 [Didymosphaeria enalia]
MAGSTSGSVAASQHVNPQSAFESPTFEKDVSIYVEEDIGAASISPSGRDVVLASKNGLLIIDLDKPYSPPRHVVYRTNWDVADVQWSPFASRPGWIVSTSCQKALVFNLFLHTPASVAPLEHVLHAHDRAITDINFSAHHPDLLATCAVDSFVYTWDLRASQRFANSFADFEAGASQVKWSRKNEYLIASSHNRVLNIWDVRRGASPLSRITAHNTSINGLDWHRNDGSKLLTCSLDKTIKLWEKVDCGGEVNFPCRVIRSDYPVWRARHTPFPNGILAMPQRGSSALDLYTHDAGGSIDTAVATKSAHSFKAHEEGTRLQEFLWRSRGTVDDNLDNREFQLVTWGTDRHLRLHSVPSDLLLNAVGFKRGGKITEEPTKTRRGAAYVSFRDDGGPALQTILQNEISGFPQQQAGGLSTMFKGVTPEVHGSAVTRSYEPPRATMTAGTVRTNESWRIVNHLRWSEGVKIEDHDDEVADLPDAPMSDHASDIEGELSSDEDIDDEDDQQDLINSSLSNANVPTPIQATARFSMSGLLSVVRIPSLAPPASQPVGLTKHGLLIPPKNGIFESFGRLIAYPGADDDSSMASPTSSMGSWDSSSSPSSGSEHEVEVGAPMGPFQPPLAWQKAGTRFGPRASQPSSMNEEKPGVPKSRISILSSAIESFIPSKKYLAEEYRIFGDGPTVCLHNAEAARRSGFTDLADIWKLCSIILSNEVPLEILSQTHRREPVLVLARRAIVKIRRKDSGLDLAFDDPDAVSHPKLKGRIKWGHHPIVSWLIPSLFDHFERLADTQMLAMLSCIFSEPAAREGVSTAMAKMRQANIPMSLQAPAFSLDYFSSADAAWSLFKPTISIPSTPVYSRYATPVSEYNWHRFSKNLDTYGSHGSSNGPWGSDTMASEPVTPYSTGNTPPNLSRVPTLRSMTSNTPFSTSPEQSQTVKKTPSTNFANAIATLSRPFANAMSSSPPAKPRIEGDLSTSAPTSSVTWGTTTFFSSGSQDKGLAPARSKHGKRASFGQADRLNIDYYSDSDSDYGESGFGQDGLSEYTAPITPPGDGDRESVIKATLKNQDKFDDEACVSAPLLDMSREWLYRAWREQYAEMLGCWGLVSKRAEVLKFNGLISYFPPEERTVPKAGSMHLVLKNDNNEVSAPSSAPLSRTSTLGPPPTNFLRRSPSASPRHFSFNPEALEFTPGASFMPEIPAPPPDVFIPSEQYLRLGIPGLDNALGESNGLSGNSMGFDGMNDRLKPRPGMSRSASELSRRSFGGVAAKKKEPLYSCSICWLRVSGRFYLCPACGHVAHFDCMPAESDQDESFFAKVVNNCIVGCGCGCEFEDEEGEVGEILKGGWDERGGWLPEIEVEDSPKANAVGYEGGYGNGMGKWVDTVQKRSNEKKKVKGKSKGFGKV